MYYDLDILHIELKFYLNPLTIYLFPINGLFSLKYSRSIILGLNIYIYTFAFNY